MCLRHLCIEFKNVCACRAKIAKLELFVAQEYILNFDVSMRNRGILTVHMHDSATYFFDDVQNLLFLQSFGTIPH